jgi:hypothetical protein
MGEIIAAANMVDSAFFIVVPSCFLFLSFPDFYFKDSFHTSG